MNRFKVVFFTCIVAVFVVSGMTDLEQDTELLLDKSGPYVGADTAHDTGLTGKGITVAVIDTGVDFAHPDLKGFSKDGKVIGGYNFVNGDMLPDDKNGHGTQVAGIIAANGGVTGMAPNAKILSYKVSADGEAVSSDLIVDAVKKAVEDGADIINISLGVNKTNSRIDAAVAEATDMGVLVVVAAGNDGPRPDTIGSPARNPDVITVGATYNNITSSLVSTFEINQKQYQVIPMLGVDAISHPISGTIQDAKYARSHDFETDVAGSILLAERGGDKDEIIYFAEKESNAADAGAAAIIVYNNEPGIYLGDVSESTTIKDYTPRIPILSISQKDGLEIKDAIHDGHVGVLRVFYDPDYVAFFSSRGPVSPFYLKPDMVAPGAFVNSTNVGGAYNFSSGTSFAAPHVSGAAALLLEKHPNLSPSEVKSILTSTAAPVTDAYGHDFATADAGAGRLDIENALGSRVIIEPAFVIMTFSPAERQGMAQINIRGISEPIHDVAVQIKSPEFIKTNHTFENGTLYIDASTTHTNNTEHEATITIMDGQSTHRVPIIFRHVEGSVAASQKDGVISLRIDHPQDWKYAKVLATNKDTGKSFVASLTPNGSSEIRTTSPGTYWISTSIESDDTYNAYDTIHVSSPAGFDVFTEIGIPQKTAYIISALVIVLALVGVRFRG